MQLPSFAEVLHATGSTYTTAFSGLGIHFGTNESATIDYQNMMHCRDRPVSSNASNGRQLIMTPDGSISAESSSCPIDDDSSVDNSRNRKRRKEMFTEKNTKHKKKEKARRAVMKSLYVHIENELVQAGMPETEPFKPVRGKNRPCNGKVELMAAMVEVSMRRRRGQQLDSQAWEEIAEHVKRVKSTMDKVDEELHELDT